MIAVAVKLMCDHCGDLIATAAHEAAMGLVIAAEIGAGRIVTAGPFPALKRYQHTRCPDRRPEAGPGALAA